MLTLTGVETWGYGWFSCLEWKLGGLFGLLTGVKSLIRTCNDKKSVIWGCLIKMGQKLTKWCVGNPHTYVSSLFVLKNFFYDINKLTGTNTKSYIF